MLDNLGDWCCNRIYMWSSLANCQLRTKAASLIRSPTALCQAFVYYSEAHSAWRLGLYICAKEVFTRCCKPWQFWHDTRMRTIQQDWDSQRCRANIMVILWWYNLSLWHTTNHCQHYLGTDLASWRLYALCTSKHNLAQLICQCDDKNIRII